MANRSLGPGKGTLMRDMLNIVNKFPECKKAVTVHMVELSEFMRRVQIQALCEEAAGMNGSTHSLGF